MLAIVFVLASCTSTSKLYNSGRYEQAVIGAVRKLRSSPDNKENQGILLNAYPMAVQSALRNINNALQSNNVTKYDVVINQYEQLNNLAAEIYACPKANELIPAPQEFHAELQESKEIAAAYYYDLGVNALNEHTVEQARNAYQYFVSANKYAGSYRDVISKMDEALYAATLRVVVEAPPMPERYQISAAFFYSNLVTEMNKTNQQRFVLFYTPEEAQSAGMKNPHQYIVLDFLDFSVGNLNESKSSQEIKRDSVPIQVELNGRQTTAYTTAKATLTTFRRQLTSGGKLRVQIMDAANNRVIEQRTFDGSYVWTSVWGSYTGDDRALSNEQKRIAAQEAAMPPPNQDLFIEFTKPIYSQVVSYVRNIYRRYQ
jgi:tetratricopeptide (TPR) repeat protein